MVDVKSERPHPTAAEWDARKAALPPAALAQIAEIREERARAELAKLAEEAARLARGQARRNEFEAGVAAYLVVCGAEWLAAYRVPDDRVPEGWEFKEGRDFYAAHFDAREAGLWPVRLDMREERGGTWVPTPNCWVVARPKCGVVARSFREALRLAAEYSHTPF